VSRPHQIRVSCADLFGTGSAPNIPRITGLNEPVARLCAAARGLHGTLWGTLPADPAYASSPVDRLLSPACHNGTNT